MSDERNRPVWPWVVVLTISMTVLYVASFGPACWMVSRRVIPLRITAWVYGPLARLVYCKLPFVARPLGWYARVGKKPLRSYGHYEDVVDDMNSVLDGY